VSRQRPAREISPGTSLAANGGQARSHATTDQSKHQPKLPGTLTRTGSSDNIQTNIAQPGRRSPTLPRPIISSEVPNSNISSPSTKDQLIRRFASDGRALIKLQEELATFKFSPEERAESEKLLERLKKVCPGLRSVEPH
jgi:hypothetical protein